MGICFRRYCESQKNVADRMKSWIFHKLKECSLDIDHHIAVFTHGLAIKFLLAEILDLDRNTAYSGVNPIDNTSMTQFYYQNGQLRLTERNNTTHLHN